VKTDTVGKIKWDKAHGGTAIEWANDFKITMIKDILLPDIQMLFLEVDMMCC